MKKIIYWIIKKYFNFVFDWKIDELADEQALSHWYKARRMGYKKKDMGFYYSDLERSKYES